jgi:hypothetical protein
VPIEIKPNYAPYASAVNVLTAIRKLRERGWPDPLTAQDLVRMGNPEGSATRTFVALRFLGLIDGEGQTTERREALRRAPSEEYAEALSRVVREAYAPVFQYVDPATASVDNLNDAFRGYEPQAQRENMVNLFTALCREAGLMPGGPLEVVNRSRDSAKRSPSGSERVKPPAPANGTPKAEEEAHASSPAPEAERPDYHLLNALLKQLPVDGRWTAERRRRWIAALTANVDLLVEEVDAEGAGTNPG